MFALSKVVSAAAAITLLVCAAAPAGAGDDDAVAPGNAGEEKTEDVWEGVRVSGAYDKLKCPRCGTANELRAAECKRCGYPFPQPSPDVTDPNLVFVPGRGYYREGALLEPPQSRKALWIPGVVISAVGLSTLSLALALWAAEESDDTGIVSEGAKGAAWGGLAITAVGATLTIIGFTSKTEAVYAYAQPAAPLPFARAAGESPPGRAGNPTFAFGLSFNLM